MKVEQYLPCVATIGFFDGVHRGHRYLIEQVRKAAAERGIASAVVTFPQHPRQVMHPDFHPALLTTCEEKVDLLAQTGIDYCLMMDFTPQTAQLSAREFMVILKERYGVKALVIGYDHRFGHNRSEGFDDYVRYGRELGMEVIQASRLPAPLNPVNKLTSKPVDENLPTRQLVYSSTIIRNLLLEGKVSEAAFYLGYCYFLNGTVVDGYRVGRRIGFPTANLRVSDTDKLIPADGVYAVRVRLGGKEYGGMLDIGRRPTMENGTARSIEVHIFHFEGDAYRQPIRLSFVQRTRAEQKFDTVEQLIARLHKDEAEIKAILSERESNEAHGTQILGKSVDGA